jgi:hypothetical protein
MPLIYRRICRQTIEVAPANQKSKRILTRPQENSIKTWPESQRAGTDGPMVLVGSGGTVVSHAPLPCAVAAIRWGKDVETPYPSQL